MKLHKTSRVPGEVSHSKNATIALIPAIKVFLKCMQHEKTCFWVQTLLLLLLLLLVALMLRAAAEHGCAEVS